MVQIFNPNLNQTQTQTQVSNTTINNHYLLPGITPDEDTWVDDFVTWSDYNNNLPAYYLLDLPSKFRKKGNKGVWVQYNNGVYVEREELAIKNEVYDWLRANQLKMSTHNTNEAMERLSTKRLAHVNEFDVFNNNQIVNCLNGLYDKERRVLSNHKIDFLSLLQFKCQMLAKPSNSPDDGMKLIQDFRNLQLIKKKMPCYLKMKKYYTQELEWIEKYCQMVIFNDIYHKLVLYCVGSPNSGKSTLDLLLNRLFMGIASNQPIDEIGEKWGLQPLIAKRVNIDSDTGMSPYSNMCLGRLKRIIGDPHKAVEVPIIYGGSIEVCLSPFFINFGNQEGKLPRNANRTAWGKRIWMIVLDHVFEDNENFERNILKEVDAFFTYLLLKPYSPLRRKEFGSVRDFQKRNLEIWDEWSNPLRKIISELFERSDSSEDFLRVTDVEGFVYDRMDDDDLEHSNHDDRDIRIALKRMKITQKTVKIDEKNSDKCYIGIKLKTDNNKIEKPKIKIKEEKNTSLDNVITQNEKEKSETKVKLVENETLLTWEKNHNDDVFQQVLTLHNADPNRGMKFEDIFEPLFSKKDLRLNDVRRYLFQMEDSGFIRKNDDDLYLYIGKMH